MGDNLDVINKSFLGIPLFLIAAKQRKIIENINIKQIKILLHLKKRKKEMTKIQIKIYIIIKKVRQKKVFIATVIIIQ